MKTERVGANEYKDFRTEFLVTPVVKKYCEDNNCSLAVLIEDCWTWYEVLLFDTLDGYEEKEGVNDLGKEFKVVYYGILLSRKLEASDNLVDDCLLDEIANTEISSGERSVGDFRVKYKVYKK